MADYIHTEQPYTDETPPEFDTGGYQRQHHSQKEDDIRNRVASYVKTRVSDQIVLSGAKLKKAANAMKKTGNCFNEEEQNLLGEYVTKAAQKIEDASSYLQETPFERIKEDARRMSLRNPWLFMGACFTGGVVLARFLKASQGHNGDFS